MKCVVTPPVLGTAASRLPRHDRVALERCLGGLSRLEDEAIAWGQTYSHPVKWGDPFEPWVLRFMLVDVVGCRDQGRSEKIALGLPVGCR